MLWGLNMNKAQKIEFINELIDNVKSDVLEKVERMPDNWNGFELRWYLADKFTHKQRICETKHTERFRSYVNDIYTIADL